MAATTSLLGLLTPTQGTLSGTWGDSVNYGISDYVDIAVSGTLTLTNDGAVTLANTTGSSSGNSITSSLTGAGTVTAQFAIVKVTGTLTVAKVVTGPSYSKTYTVVNSATGGIVTFKASGQTGVSVAVGETAFVYFNGTDYVKVVGTATAGAAGGSTTQVQYNNAGVLAGITGATTNGTALTLVAPVLGTPASATLTFATGLPISTGVSGLGTGVATFLGTPSSANLASAVTDETGTGSLVFATSPTLVTPVLGVATATSLQGIIGNVTPAAGTFTQVDITAQGTLRLQDTTGGEYVALRAPATLAGNYTLTFPADDGTSGQALITDGSGVLSWSTAASGDVYGPASSTDNAIVRFDSTTGKLIQNSVGILSDAGILTGLTGITSSGSITFSSLTSGRVPYATTAGLLTDSANLLYSGTDLTVYGLTVGRGAGAVATNTAVGVTALSVNVSGSANTALGYQALKINTASDNTALSAYALQSNVGGVSNVAIGSLAMITNTSGSYNTAIGAGINGLLQGALGLNDTGSNNTAIGYAALRGNTTASNNTAVGYQAAYSNTTGTGNTATGIQALYSNTIGDYNAANGRQAMYFNTSGSFNVAFGNGTMESNTTGSYNTAYGALALGSNTTASNNTAVGYQARYGSDTESANTTAIGYQAMGLFSATTADATGSVAIGFRSMWTYNATTAPLASNTAVGTNSLSLYSTTSATVQTNTAIGLQAMEMYSNTTGNAADNVAVGVNALRMYNNTTQTTSFNVAIGRDALVVNQSSNNTAVGYQAGYTNSTGTFNTYIGGRGAGFNATGSQNTFVGDYAGREVTTGGFNTLIGQGSGYLITTGAKNTIVGLYNGNQDSLDIRTASNYIVLSDGDGARQITMKEGQTLALDSAVPNAGTGITFPATQSASSDANTLDDYEEGTWTPVVSDLSNNNATLSDAEGVYTKIGNIVYWRFNVVLSSTASMVAGDTVIVTGFPFTSAAIAGNWYNPSATIIRNITFTGYVQFHQNSSTTYGYFRENVSNAAGDNITVSDCTNSAAMQASGFYRVSGA